MRGIEIPVCACVCVCLYRCEHGHTWRLYGCVCDTCVNTDCSDKQQTQEVMSVEPIAFYVCVCVCACVLEGNSDRYVHVSNGIHAHSDNFTASRHKHYRLLTLTESPAYLDHNKKKPHTHKLQTAWPHKTHTHTHTHTHYEVNYEAYDLNWAGHTVRLCDLTCFAMTKPYITSLSTHTHTHTFMGGIYGMLSICLQSTFPWNSVWSNLCECVLDILSSLCMCVCNLCMSHLTVVMIISSSLRCDFNSDYSANRGMLQETEMCVCVCVSPLRQILMPTADISKA